MLALSFIGAIYFRHYKGEVISNPTLWFIGSITLGVVGVALTLTSFKKIERTIEEVVDTRINHIKANANKILLDFDKCEFKSGTFSHMIDDPNMTAVKVFAPGASSSLASTKISETVTQSYLTYGESINGKQCKFISQSFPFDITTLKFYVLNHNISLYIDQSDHSKYIFELNREVT